MNFKSLVGQRVSVTAIVDRITSTRYSSSDMMLLKNVFINGSYFRGHAWVKLTRRMKVLSSGDKFTATAELMDYIDIDTNKKDKIGLKSFRHIKVIG